MSHQDLSESDEILLKPQNRYIQKTGIIDFTITVY